ncbi:tRNA (adenosine(37)-N6)-threonylcarbamoyltransferase complex ATPase subunit type 1 TsaE [Nodosilinea nodulosa]|uniref:tRNA (adenosine(37)-N6)-threonylcarbamoyltransferase complex ATPase subunit type 1 TsaE n=1 Tax=Nodosilinea nodulosa TaxID=416001 RepID=UPI00035E8AB2
MTWALGHRLGQWLEAGTVLLLSGDLGSGKTTLVQGVGAGLGIAGPISSPTFTLINEYLDGRLPLYHVDLYRLAPEQVDSLELESYWDALEVTPGVLAIEWAERMPDCPTAAIWLRLETVPGGGRRAILTAADKQIALLEQVIGDGLLVDEV